MVVGELVFTRRRNDDAAHDFIVMGADGPDKRSTADIFDGKKIVLIGVPGAFTPTCHSTHLPGFLSNLDALKDKGVDSVAVTTVNDVHVVNAWAKATEGNGKIEYLADGNGDFAKAIGMDADLAIAGIVVDHRQILCTKIDQRMDELDRTARLAKSTDHDN